MNKLSISINSTPVVLFFGYACFKNLSEKWGIPGYQGVLNRLASFGSLTDDLAFEQMEMIGDIVEAALAANPEKQPDFTRGDIMDDVLVDMMKIVDIIKCMLAATQKPTTPDAIKESDAAGKTTATRKK